MDCCWTKARSFLWSRGPVQEEPLPTRRKRRRSWGWEAWAGNSSENCRTWWEPTPQHWTAAQFVFRSLHDHLCLLWCRGWSRRRTCWLRLSSSSPCGQRCCLLTFPSEWLRRSCLLENQSRCLKTTTTAPRELVVHSAMISAKSRFSLYFTKRIRHMMVLLCLGSILKHQEDLFAAELHRLKQQPLFSLVDFENMIDRIRSTVAEVSSDTAV